MKMAELRLRLRELRENRELSQAEMAKKLGVSQQTYSRYESHTTEIPLKLLITLVELYDTSTDYLLGITNQDKAYPKIT